MLRNPARPLVFATAALLLAAGVGGCSRSEPDPATTENLTLDLPADETDTAPPEPLPPAEPLPPIDNAAAAAEPELPPETRPAPDEQMLDDASATGMTARAERGGERADGADGADATERPADR